MTSKPIPVADVRRANLEALIRAHTSAEAFSAASGVSAVYVSQLRNETADTSTGKKRAMGSVVARRIEAKLKLDHGWMDVPHVEAVPVQAPQPATTLPSLEREVREAAPPYTGTLQLSASEIDLVLALRLLSPRHRDKFVADAMLAAEQANPAAMAALAKHGVKFVVSNDIVGAALPPHPDGGAPETTPGELAPPSARR